MLRDYKDTNFLTSLRAIAILLVFLTHAGGAGLKTMGPYWDELVNIGMRGVQLFFVISGFTIFSQFFTEHYTVRNFLLVRIARISIPYFPILLLLFLYINLGGAHFNPWLELYANGGISIANLLAHTTYLSSYFIQFQNTIIGVEWTLGIEVFYYLSFALLVYLGWLKREWRSLILLGIFSILVTIASIQFVPDLLHVSSRYVHWTPANYSYMFLLGGLAYYLRGLLERSANSFFGLKKSVVSDLVLGFSVLIYATSAAVLPTLSVSPAHYYELVIALLSFFVITFFNSDGTLSRLLENKYVLFLGAISYSFYLIHFPVVQLLPSVPQVQLDFVIKFFVSILLAWGWYTIFEKRMYSTVKKKILRTG